MFLHTYKYYFKQLSRNKAEIFWILVFPILLGTMFYFAFGNLFDKEEVFKAIPVAIVSDGSANADTFSKIADELAKDGDDQLLKITYADEKKALSLLKDKSVTGVIYAGDTLSLSVLSKKGDYGIEESILKSFLDQYLVSQTAITEILTAHPENHDAVTSILTKDINYNQEKNYSKGNMDIYVQYFYNLIAMVCLYGSISGMYTAIKSQANLSSIGARKNVSPTHKLLTIAAELSATVTVQFACILVTLFYLVFILKVNFGGNPGLIILTTLVGSIVGVSFGFFIGSLSTFSENIKNAILMSVSMLLCFFSGLMVGNMRAIVEQHFPIFNKINPAALLSDSFYSLNIYDTYERYTQNIITLLIISAILCVGGFLVVRRQKYASL